MVTVTTTLLITDTVPTTTLYTPNRRARSAASNRCGSTNSMTAPATMKYTLAAVIHRKPRAARCDSRALAVLAGGSALAAVTAGSDSGRTSDGALIAAQERSSNARTDWPCSPRLVASVAHVNVVGRLLDTDW